MIDPVREVCTHCRWCVANDQKQPECWHDPPAVVGEALFQAPLIPGGPPRMNWLMQAVRPVVKPAWRCSRFEPKDQIVN